MLTVKAHGIFSRTYGMYSGNTLLTEFSTGSWKEKAEVELGGNWYRFEREKTLSGPFLLLDAESVLASAEKPSAFKDKFLISFQGRNFELKKRSIWRSAFDLIEGDEKVGSVERKGFFRTLFTIDLPEGLSDIFAIFVFWLALIIWTREDTTAATSG